MKFILAILGLSILTVVTIDILVTTLTLGGGGPITSRFTTWVWKLLIQIHRRHSNHRMLATVGWVLLVSITLIWYICTSIGWICLFNSATAAVINASSKEPADIWETIYFVGYTLSTLGMGDYQPQGIVWQMATVIASTNGFFLVTLSIAYLLPVVSAATEKRAFAVYISSLGGTADEILTASWNGKDFEDLSSHLSSITASLTQLGEQHLTYPILHYFHSVERSRSLALSLVALDEALTLLHYAIPPENQPNKATLNAARRGSAAFLKTLKSAYLESANIEPPLPKLELLRSEGIPTCSNEEFVTATKQVSQRRKLLLALVQNDGWTWNAIASSETTSRASNLDDETVIDDVVLH
ncbi:MAG: potassium channel family protein [Cyanobacteria bacterium P01_A01_bin.84]